MPGKFKAVLSANPSVERAARWVWDVFKQARLYVHLSLDHLYDLRRFAKFGHGVRKDCVYRNRSYALLKQYHGIEKGLSLAESRPGFGQDKLRGLLQTIDQWIRDYGVTGEVVPAISSVVAYRDTGLKFGVKLAFLENWLGKLNPAIIDESGGVNSVTREEVIADVKTGGRAFFFSRHSMRNFSDTPVPIGDIRKAVEIAQKSPSVCNRQGGRIYCFENAEEALNWQPGNRGFGHLASYGCIVTTDLRAFSSSTERNQNWIDGGMFAMSFIYALHALGHGSCPLAWSQRAGDDEKMRKALDIPDHETVVMMIAVGGLPEEFKVAKAYRLPLSHAIVER